LHQLIAKALSIHFAAKGLLIKVMIPQLSPGSFDHLKVRHLILANLAITVGLGILLGTLRINPESSFFMPIVYIFSMTATCVWAWRRCQHLQINVSDVIGKLPTKVSWLKIIGLTVLVLAFSLGSGLVFLSLLSYLFPSLVTIFTQSSKVGDLAASASLADKVWLFLVLVVFAPLTEEFLFRGIILNRWSQKWGMAKSLLATSLFFGFLHANPVGLSMFGLVMGLLYLRTQTLWIPVICHTLNNLVVFLVTATSNSDVERNPDLVLASLRMAGWFGALLLAISLPILLLFIKKNFPKRNHLPA
jgi:uncharacterized protein